MRLGIVQAPIRRASSGAGLSVALYAPCRHLQQPADRAREDERDFDPAGFRAVRQNKRIIAFDACDRPLACNVCRQSIQVAAPGRRAGTTLAFIDALGPPLDHLVDQPELLRSLGGKERVALHSLFHLLDRLAGVFHVNLV